MAVGADATLPPARRTIDAREQYVIPGLIDAHVHMGSEEDASIAEGLAREHAGGDGRRPARRRDHLRHFVGQRNEPLVPNIETTIREGNRWSRVDYFFHAIVSTDGHHAELPAVWDLGVTSFKHFFNAYKPRPTEGLSWLGGPSDAGMLLRSLRFCAERGAPGICIVHCEDIDVVAVLEDELMAAGRTDLGAWSDARPNVAEYSRIAMAIDLARTARAPIYIAHMSTAEGADRVAAARRDGWPVWAEVTPHHLTHTGTMEAEVGCWGKVNPRSARPRTSSGSGARSTTEASPAWDRITAPAGARTPPRPRGPKHGNIWNARSGNRGGSSTSCPC